MDKESIDWVAGYGLASVVGLPAILFVGYQIARNVFRRAVRDGLEVTKDRKESDFVAQLMKHNDNLTISNTALRADFERLSKERAEVLAKVGKLESDLEHANSLLQTAFREIALLRKQVGPSLSLTSNRGTDHEHR